MDTLPNEMLIRIFALLADRKGLYTHIPLVNRRFREIQTTIRQACTVVFSVTIMGHNRAFSVEDLQDLCELLDGQDKPPRIAEIRKSMIVMAPCDRIADGDGVDPWSRYNLKCSILLKRPGLEDVAPHDVAETLMRVLRGVTPFGNARVGSLSFLPDKLPSSWLIPFANLLDAELLGFMAYPLKEAPKPPLQWLSEDIQTVKSLRARHVRLLNAPLETIFFFPNAGHIEVTTFIKLVPRSVPTHSDHFDHHEPHTVEILELGDAVSLPLPFLHRIAESIRQGQFPRLRRIHVTFSQKDGGAEKHTSAIRALLAVLDTVPTVRLRVLTQGDKAKEMFLEKYQKELLSRSTRVEVVLDTVVPSVVLECSLGPGFFVH
ncbi:hypothetical protein M427DRAFT_73289 [Gonapodya prolifera JEL478]|uniref:F-box domain-containing protein n=1 Tax=Gonapodya prolifera (strain JEL478) TaxID=1344416 RepID=A0A139A331_GONPJ|nr:hypothetical protein M427DRAFT_73289 [Gonapodya prolifera JEL478]|eukprot:KXS11079.1 hypothetical protein M427DRAFT_73289 [Gonapodya prolifera JEL478]